MDIIYELTEAECEAVAGGLGGASVAFLNHSSGTGPGNVFQELNKDFVAMGFPSRSVGAMVSGAVAFAKTITFTGSTAEDIWGGHIAAVF